MMENNYFFVKKIHIKPQGKKKDVLVMVILYYCEKRRIPTYLIKTVLKRTSNAIIQHEEKKLA